MTKKLWLAIITGGVLGIFCIIWGALRLGWQGNQLLIISLWYNRLLMGFVIGLASGLVLMRGELNWLLRGAVLGLIVSAAYFLTTGAADWVPFLAGPIYGVVIEFILRRTEKIADI